jgi:hypothetical protein
MYYDFGSKEGLLESFGKHFLYCLMTGDFGSLPSRRKKHPGGDQPNQFSFAEQQLAFYRFQLRAGSPRPKHAFKASCRITKTADTGRIHSSTGGTVHGNRSAAINAMQYLFWDHQNVHRNEDQVTNRIDETIVSTASIIHAMEFL